MKILITGFEPFGEEDINPSYEAVKQIGKIAGVSIVKEEIPVVFGEASEYLIQLIAQHQPDSVVLVGQAGGRAEINVERVAINICDTAYPDNAGNIPQDQPVVEGGESAYFATIPIKKIVDAVRNAHLPAKVSNTAGTYVCNELMYSCLRHLHGTGISAGFIHVPYSSEQVQNKPGVPSMDIPDIARSLEVIIETIAAHRNAAHQNAAHQNEAHQNAAHRNL